MIPLLFLLCIQRIHCQLSNQLIVVDNSLFKIQQDLGLAVIDLSEEELLFESRNKNVSAVTRSLSFHECDSWENEIYCVGGQVNDTLLSRYIYSIDVTKDACWRANKIDSDGPTKGIVGHKVKAMEGKLFVFGGYYLSSDKKVFTNDIYSYDFEIESWEKYHNNHPPIERAFHLMLVIGGHELMVIGGQDENGTALNDIWVWNSHSEEWKEKIFDHSQVFPLIENVMQSEMLSNHEALIVARNNENDKLDIWILHTLGMKWSKLESSVNFPKFYSLVIAQEYIFILDNSEHVVVIDASDPNDMKIVEWATRISSNPTLPTTMPTSKPAISLEFILLLISAVAVTILAIAIAVVTVSRKMRLRRYRRNNYSLGMGNNIIPSFSPESSRIPPRFNAASRSTHSVSSIPVLYIHPESPPPLNITDSITVMDRFTIIRPIDLHREYLALDKLTGKLVSINIFSDASTYHRQTEMLLMIQSQHALKLIVTNEKAEFGTQTRRIIVSEYLEDILSQFIDEIVVDENIIKELIKAVQALHSKGIIHLNIHPDNFRKSRDGPWKLVKFEFCKFTHSHQPIVIRHPEYSAPELLETFLYKQRLSSSLSLDVWSLGCMIYYLIAKKFPFQYHTDARILLQTIESNLPRLFYLESRWNNLLTRMIVWVPGKRITLTEALNSLTEIDCTGDDIYAPSCDELDVSSDSTSNKD